MSLGGFFVRVHATVSRIVLGKRLIERASRVREASRSRQERLSKLCDDVEDTTHQLKKDLGLVHNGANAS